MRDFYEKRITGMSGRDNFNAHQWPLESIDHPDLLGGTKRFGELKKSIGTVSQKVLTSNLRSMEESGLLTRKVYAEVPPRVEYTLTETGYSLKTVLDAMAMWGTEYKQKTQ